MQYNLLGIIFILYGFLKLGLIVSLMFIPPTIQKKLAEIEGFDLFISGDETLSGKMYEYVLFVFAIFSIVHGMALLGIFSENFHHLIESKHFQYTFYIVLGLWLMIFYGLVVYTKIPIEKEEENMHNYKIYGYLGGLSFLLVPPIWIIIEHLNPFLERMREEKQLMYMTFVMLSAIFIVFLTYIVIKRLRRMKQQRIQETVKTENKIEGNFM